jgi:dsRNA-specific ribonuclease
MSNIHGDLRFKGFIVNLLKKAGLTNKYISILTNDESMVQFTNAFTHISFDPINNYEYYETIGDVTTNKIVVWYFYRRFPELKTTIKKGNMGSIAIMSRLKQTGVSNATYDRYSRDLGLNKFLRISPNCIENKSSIYADLFESFIGCMELLIDDSILTHAGYGICYSFLELLIDKDNIKLERNILYDPKSIINEYISSFKRRLEIKYISRDTFNGKSRQAVLDSGLPMNKRFEVYVEIIDKQTNNIYRSQYGYGTSKSEAEKNAARHVIDSNYDGLPK